MTKENIQQKYSLSILILGYDQWLPHPSSCRADAIDSINFLEESLLGHVAHLHRAFYPN